MPLNIKLSVVIPNFNFDIYLMELLSSLNKLKNRHCLQVILVDGGSTDKSTEVANDLLQSHDIFLTGPDGGQADAIGKGLRLATGNWFMFQNSDDMFDIYTLDEFLGDSFDTSQVEVVAFDQDFLVQTTQGWSRTPGFRHCGQIRWRQLYRSIYFTNQATIYNRKNAQEIGIDSNKQFAMDYDFVVRFFKRYSPSVQYVHKVLGFQRIHKNTKTSTLQPICVVETRQIINSEFTILDRTLGFFAATIYYLKRSFLRLK